MGVRCKLLGHVHDSTEFEERQEMRPNGTVLICREYQICRRCGDREEMYRNEQVLASETAEADSRTERTTTDTGSSDDESDPNQVNEQDEQDTARAPAEEPETTDGDSQAATATSDAGGADHVTDDAVIVSDSTTDASPSAVDTPTRADGTGHSLTAHDEGGSPTSSFDLGKDSHRQISCKSCGREWRRDATSLREGDLCPGCREAYVEGS
jgi:hypothetical protein